jgi:multidrug efflux pump subunit AcrB
VPRGRPSLAERQGQEVPKRDESHVGTRDALGTGLLRRIDAGLQRILRFGFAHRWLALVVGAPLLGLGVLAAWLGPVRVLPAVDEGAILIEYIMPPATSLAESDHIGSILEGEALAQPDVQTVYRRTGSPERGLQTEAVNRGELTIKLAPRALRTHTLDQIMNRLRSIYNGIPGVTFLYHQPSQEKMDESLSGLPATFGVTIFGNDPNELIALSAQAEQIMTRDPALTNVINNARFRSPQITVRPDPVELAQYHLEPAALFDVIKAGRCGVPATTILRQSQEIQVLLFLYPEAANSAGPTSRFSPPMTLASLRQLAIPTSSGESIPLERVADIDIAHTPSAITHLNGQREITILAEVSGSVAAVVARLRQSLSAVALPSGDSIAFTGQYEVIRRMVRDFVLTAVLAVTLIYFIMAIEFGSWSQPLLILLTVPIALIGAVVLLAITRVGIDVSVGMGGLTLVGISVNNAIVLLAYANRDTARGLARPAALSSAVSARLRPILMTALTTIIALVPVAVNPAVGSRIFQPFAITVTGGLFSATAATLILLPLLVNRRSTRRSGT